MANLPTSPAQDTDASSTTPYTGQWRFKIIGGYLVPYQYVNGGYHYMPTQEAIRAFKDKDWKSRVKAVEKLTKVKNITKEQAKNLKLL